MITRLTGRLIVKKPPLLEIEIAGVGYECQASMTTFYQLPEPGEQVSLFTHLQIREDAHTLFGFFDAQERAVFRELVKISGVGPKLALTILSGLDVQALLQCVEQQDAAKLVGLPGVGKKTAQRLLVEMEGIFSKKLTGMLQTLTAPIFSQPNQAGGLQAQTDAIAALVSLGYKPAIAEQAVQKLTADPTESTEGLIRQALRQLSL